MTVTAIGARTRLEAAEKVAGTATYAQEYVADGSVVGWIHGAEIAKGRVLDVDTATALRTEGVLAVFWHGNAPKLGIPDDPMVHLLQNDRVAFRGQVVALVVAESAEIAREASAKLLVRYESETPDVVLTKDHPTLYEPAKVNGGAVGRSEIGDADGAFAVSPVTVEAEYSTPPLHNNAMEPHATLAAWDGDNLTVHDANQGGNAVQAGLSQVFKVDPSTIRVISTHIGGGFGAKGTPRPNVVLAALAARELNRPVKVVLTRQMLFALVGYRTPTQQRIRLGADTKGKLISLSHDSISQTTTLKEFAEQTSIAARLMYDGDNRRTTHQVAVLDVPIPSWMRAPGEAPGMFALESAMDELAHTLAMDPVALRILNEPAVHPESGLSWSSRGVVECLRQGADRFDWAARQQQPGARRDGEWLIGAGVALSTYPTYMAPSTARVQVNAAGEYTVSINATDLGTGARTAIWMMAAEVLDVDPAKVAVEIGDTSLPPATLAGGSMGTASWGWAITKAAEEMNKKLTDGPIPDEGISVTASTGADIKALAKYARHAFGAQFAEVRVNAVTGEVRVPRMVGVFGAGRIVNSVTARSQLIGGMTMGLGMALHEQGVVDAEFGDFVNHDLAGYHIPSHADIPDFDISWIEESDTEINPLGAKGIGEIGIVGAAAAVANAVFNATGIRVRDLPITVDKLWQ